jgi:hypothetical protein
LFLPQNGVDFFNVFSGNFNAIILIGVITRNYNRTFYRVAIMPQYNCISCDTDNMDLSYLLNDMKLCGSVVYIQAWIDSLDKAENGEFRCRGKKVNK